jgi:Flp pilus assembly protein TadG
VILGKFCRDERGATALEFAILAPVFFLLIFAVIAFGLLFWTQVGLQHGAEMAARCASINAALCPTTNSSAITSYATQQALGLTLPANTYSYAVQSCGNQVTGSYTFVYPDIFNFGPLTVTAQACFPA